MKILLVDDDPSIAKLIGHKLQKNSYTVEFAFDGKFAIDLLKTRSYSLVLLDLMLPKLSGIEVCQTLRRDGIRTPVMMLTGQEHTDDKVCGLDAGADDYLVKPFELDELTARVRALTRRTSEVASAVISHGPLRLDLNARMLTYRGQPVSLRPKELSILELMLRYPARVFDPDTILDRLWDLSDCPGRATVKTHIRSVRKRLVAVGADSVIETVYGRGYRLSRALIEDVRRIPQAGIRQTQVDSEKDLASIDGEIDSEIDGEKISFVESSSLEDSGLGSSDFSSATNQEIIDETWQQVQQVSWYRISRLEQLVNSQRSRHRQPSIESLNQLLIEPPNQFPMRANRQPSSWRNNREAAIEIAHQLKGTLGSFGFQAASLQAKQVQTLLQQSHESLVRDSAEISLLQSQVDLLKKMVEQRMTAELPEPKRPYALLACQDHNWAQTVQCLKQDLNQDSALAVEICSPLEIDNHLLAQTPAVIWVEISAAEQSRDLSLLSALARNYGNQIPIVAVLNAAHPDAQQMAIHHGANVIVLKSWSAQTLRAIITEFV